MSLLRTLIIDDERLAREGLRKALEPFSDIEIVGEAQDVDSGLRKVQELKPDLIFLDIQMPRKSGFKLLDEISSTIKIVFVTAYDEYAIRAFEVNALDYLLKPVNPERLAKTIHRLLTQQEPEAPSVRTLLYSDQLFLMVGTAMDFIKISDIAYISASVDYTDVYFRDGKHGLVTKSMKEWELRLPSEHFLRIHRSTIINLNQVDRIEKGSQGKMQIYQKGFNEPLQISRRNLSLIRERFG